MSTIFLVLFLWQFAIFPPCTALMLLTIGSIPISLANASALQRVDFSDNRITGARFKIPPLAIYDSTESYLRNLIALEQCCPGVSQHVTSYADIMDMLVKSDNDIQVPEKARVLTNGLGPTGDATDLFNKLCKEIM
ncbi:hypothetical protein C3L33_20626, partial [Rhododendron williamsianum]